MRPRFTIGTLGFLVVLLAFDLAWVRLLHPASGRSIFAFAAQGFDLGVLPMANLLAFGGFLMLSRRQEPRPFLVGFEVFGLGAILAYMVLCWASPKAAVFLILPLYYACKLWRPVDPSGPMILLLGAVSFTLPQLLIAAIGGLIVRRWENRRRVVPIA